jgi:hypothetical protein
MEKLERQGIARVLNKTTLARNPRLEARRLRFDERHA